MMWKNIASLSLCALCAVAYSQPAEAKLRVRDVSLTLGPSGLEVPTRLEVSGSDGKYDKVLDEYLHFGVRVEARVRGGLPHKHRIFDAHLIIRPPDGSRAGSPNAATENQLKYQLLPLNYETRRLNLSHNVMLPVWKLRGHRTRIIEACNEAGSGQSEQIIQYALPVVFNVAAGSVGKAVRGSDGATLDIEIVCRELPAPRVSGQDFKFEYGDLKVTSIELFRSTFGYNHNPNAATKCQKLRVLVRVRTNRTGAVKIKLWKKVGGAAMASKETVLGAEHDGQGGFKAEYTEWITVNQQTFVQLKAEEFASPVGKSTAWKTITLTCTSAGGGGFTVGTDQPDSLPPSAPQEITGEMSLYSLKGKTCPREGRALVSLNSNKNLDIPFKVVCSFAGTTEGVAKTAPHSKGGWIAPALAKFTIDKTKKYHCRLYAKFKNDPENYKFVAVAEKDFACFSSPIVEPHSGGLTGVRQTVPSSTGGSNIANPPNCRTTWKETCKRVPDRRCSTVFKTTCTQVPKTECKNVRTRSCKMAPQRVCRMQLTRSCSRVPKLNCRTVRGKRICQRTLTTQCRPQRKRVCTQKLQRKCSVSTKRECARKITKQCARAPSQRCTSTWRNSCTRKKVRVCS